MPPKEETAWDDSGQATPAVVVDDMARLREENAKLRAELVVAKQTLHEQGGDTVTAESREWPTEIVYDQLSVSAGKVLRQLSGISKQRMQAAHIRNSNEFDYLPKPSDDQAQLQADFVRWGYCLVKDACSPAQVESMLATLVDLAAEEQAAHRANVRYAESGEEPKAPPVAQHIANLLLKRQAFRDIVEFKPNVAQRGPLIEKLLKKVMGEDFAIGCAHGSIVHTGGGLQEMHIDQASIPLPYPPWPMGSLIIWMLSEFNLEAGATYVREASSVNSSAPFCHCENNGG